MIYMTHGRLVTVTVFEVVFKKRIVLQLALMSD